MEQDVSTIRHALDGGDANGEIVKRAERTRTVTDGSAGLRFPLTCGIANDELVRLGTMGLENSLNRWPEQACRIAMAARA